MQAHPSDDAFSSSPLVPVVPSFPKAIACGGLDQDVMVAMDVSFFLGPTNSDWAALLKEQHLIPAIPAHQGDQEAKAWSLSMPTPEGADQVLLAHHAVLERHALTSSQSGATVQAKAIGMDHSGLGVSLRANHHVGATLLEFDALYTFLSAPSGPMQRIDVQGKDCVPNAQSLMLRLRSSDPKQGPMTLVLTPIPVGGL